MNCKPTRVLRDLEVLETFKPAKNLGRKDWLDIENLVRAGGMDPRGPDLVEIFHRQATPELYAEFLNRCVHDELQ